MASIPAGTKMTGHIPVSAIEPIMWQQNANMTGVLIDFPSRFAMLRGWRM
jgi:hypothetical protein